jgi:hypothetical protein
MVGTAMGWVAAKLHLGAFFVLSSYHFYPAVPGPGLVSREVPMDTALEQRFTDIVFVDHIKRTLHSALKKLSHGREG